MEKFFTAYQHTFTAMGALGTVAAVVTSLTLAYFAWRADRTRLKAWANLVIDPKNAFEFLTISITNHGKFPLRIASAFFYWKVPLKRGIILILPLDFYGGPLIGKRSYPVEVAPRASETFLISDVATFKQDVKRFRVDTIAQRSK
jgi:hypothetical protein